jgi:cell wall-associated NlpC family hydrolase
VATVTGLALLFAADARAGAPAAAAVVAPSAVVASPAKGHRKSGAAKAAKSAKAERAAKASTRGERSTRATKAERTAAGRSGKAAGRDAKKGSARAAMGGRAARREEARREEAARRERLAERAAERAAAERAAAERSAAVARVEVPRVDLPELNVAAGPAASTAAASWEAALAFSSTAPGSRPPATGAFAAFTRSATTLLDGLVARARGQLGTRYVYGAAAPGGALDCSSFVRYVMEALDVRLPRTANQQARVGRAIPRDPSLLRPGDLLTFGTGRHTSHVGIYLGGGRFIHASVKSGQVIETTMERNSSLFRRWQGARRLIAGIDTVAGDAETGG